MALAGVMSPYEIQGPVERVRRGGRYDMWLPNGRRESNLFEPVEFARSTERSAGVRMINERLLGYMEDVMAQARSYITQMTPDWKAWKNQAEGLLPARGDGMITRAGHNISLPIHSRVGTVCENATFSPRVRYEPMDDDSELGRQVARSLAEIAHQQTNHPEFDRNFRQCWQGTTVFGFNGVVAEHVKRFEAANEGGVYTDTLVDRGTSFETIMPYFLLFTDIEEPNLQLQPAVGYAHTLTLPMMESEHFSAILADETQRLAFPKGKYLNLDMVGEQTRGGANGQTYMSSGLEARTQSTLGTAGSAVIRRMPAFTWWTQELDMPGLIEDVKRETGITDDEIFLEFGWKPQDIAFCRTWKLTAVDPHPNPSPMGARAQILVQAIPNPYWHQKVPILGIQAIDFLRRTTGLGYGQVVYHLQLLLNTLIVLLADNVIRRNTDMFVIRKDLLNQPPERWGWWPNKVFEAKPGANLGELKNVITRIGADPNGGASHEATELIDRIFTMAQHMASTERPPFGGSKTAYEISKAVEESGNILQSRTGTNAALLMFEWHRIQQMNNAQFLDEKDAIKLAGDAGLDLRFVRYWQGVNDRAMFREPMRVKVVSKSRITDDVMRSKLLVEVQNSRAVSIWLELLATGQEIPEQIEWMVRVTIGPLVDDIDDMMRGWRRSRKTTEDVVKLLGMGVPVGVDLKRFKGDPQAALLELRMVRALGEQGNPLAADYADDLEAQVIPWIQQMAQMNQALGSGPGGRPQGNSRGLPAPVANSYQQPMNSMMAPNSMSMSGEDMMSNVPTEPLPQEAQ